MQLAQNISGINQSAGVKPALALAKCGNEAQGESGFAVELAKACLRVIDSVSRKVCGQLMSLQPEEVDCLFRLPALIFAAIKEIDWRGVVRIRLLSRRRSY
jgi:hypothetical protein